MLTTQLKTKPAGIRIAAIQWITGIACVAALFFAAGSTSVGAENWTRFRGPNGSGVATGVNFPAKWSDQDYRWKITLPGIGHSSPVGWEDHLFVTSGNPETGDVTLLCLSTTAGKVQWQRVFEGEPYPMHAGNSYASTTPAVDDQRVYLTRSSGGKLHCVALTHAGEDVWQSELGDFAGPHGFAASPMVVDGVVCVQVDHAAEGFLAGLEVSSGDIRWRVKRPGGKASYATPCVVADGDSGSAVISQSMEGGMQLVDVQSGNVVWEDAEAFPARCVSSPLVAEGMVIGVCGGGGSGKLLVGMGISSSNQKPIEKLMLTKQVPYVPTPLVADGRLFLWHDQGKVSMADLSADEPPKKVTWTERVGGKFFGSPILAGDKIYCLSMDGRAVVIAAAEEFQLLGENDLGEPSNATPAVHQGHMYLRTESTLACLAGQ